MTTPDFSLPKLTGRDMDYPVRPGYTDTGFSKIPQDTIFKLKPGMPDNFFPGLDLTLKPKEVSPQEKAQAQKELNTKTSSIGITYKDASETVAKIKEQYNSDEYFTTYHEFVDPNKNEGPGLHFEIYIKPYVVEHKVFDPGKIPEPAKSQFMDAQASMYEIEHNNLDLSTKACDTLTTDNIPKALPGLEDFKFPGLEQKAPTERELNAQNKLNDMVSSKGLKYSDAKAKLHELRAKYKNDPNCRSEYREKPKYTLENQAIDNNRPETARNMTGGFFDPGKIPEPDRTTFFDSLNAVHEIEQKNYALLSQTGWKQTPDYVDHFAWSHVKAL